MRHVKMELKVCEGCGGLWLRSGREAGVYCRHCAVVLAEFPAPRAKLTTGRRRRTAAGVFRGAEMASTEKNGGAR